MSCRCTSLAISILLIIAQLPCCLADGAFDDCGFVEGLTLHFICEGVITKAFRDEWKAVCPPSGVRYSFWKNKETNTDMVAFYDIRLQKCVKIKIQNYGTLFICNDSQNSEHELKLPEATVLCFTAEVPYVSALHQACVKTDKLNPPLRTIIHFSIEPNANSIECAPKISNHILLLIVNSILNFIISQIYA